MVDRNIASKLGITAEQLDEEVNQLFGTEQEELLEIALDKKVDTLVPGTILKGKIVMQLGRPGQGGEIHAISLIQEC